MKQNPYVKICGVIGGIILVVVVLFLILAQTFISQIGTIIWGLVALGIVALFFTYKSTEKKK